MRSSRGEELCRPAANEGSDLYSTLERFALNRNTATAHDECGDHSSSEVLHSSSQYEPGYHAAERFSQILESQHQRWISMHPPPQTAVEALSQRWGVSGVSLDQSLNAPTTRTSGKLDSCRPLPSNWGFSQAIEQLRGDITRLQKMPTAEEVLARMQQQHDARFHEEQLPGEKLALDTSFRGNDDRAAAAQREDTERSSGSLRGGADAAYLATLDELQVRDFFQKLLSLEREGALIHESDAEAHYIPTSVIKFRLRRARYLRHHFSSASVTHRISGAYRPFPTPVAPRPAVEL